MGAQRTGSITPDFWNRVPSSATVYIQQGEERRGEKLNRGIANTKPVQLQYGQGNPYLVALVASKGNAAGILHIVTDKGIATSVLQGLFDVRWLIANNIDHQLGPLQLPKFLICRFHL